LFELLTSFKFAFTIVPDMLNLIIQIEDLRFITWHMKKEKMRKIPSTL